MCCMDKSTHPLDGDQGPSVSSEAVVAKLASDISSTPRVLSSSDIDSVPARSALLI